MSQRARLVLDEGDRVKREAEGPRSQGLVERVARVQMIEPRVREHSCRSLKPFIPFGERVDVDAEVHAVLSRVRVRIRFRTFEDEVDRPEAGRDARSAFLFRYLSTKLIYITLCSFLSVFDEELHISDTRAVPYGEGVAVVPVAFVEVHHFWTFPDTFRRGVLLYLIAVKNVPNRARDRKPRGIMPLDVAELF